MNNFKLLGIRPLNGCARKFSKILKHGVIYKFYNNYEFIGQTGTIIGLEENDENTVAEIIHEQHVTENLYEIETNSGNIINVNISAVVGKNGSGKSTLLELLYTLCYSIAVKEDLIKDLRYNKKRFKESNDLFFSERVTEIENTVNGLKIEIFYIIDDDFYMLSNVDDSYNLFILKQKIWQKVDNGRLTEFFYTISINYSIYALNSSIDNNQWLNSLFHKNDGYQTPIVINPFRREGNIDINTEYHLAQTRILSNLTNDSLEGNYLVGNKEVSSLAFQILPEDLNTYDPVSFVNVFELYRSDNNETVIDFFAALGRGLIGLNLSEEIIEGLKVLLYSDIKSGIDSKKYTYDSKELNPTNLEILYNCAKYSVRKVYRICRQYEDFKLFYEIFSADKPIPRLKDISSLIEALKKDDSHITLKLRQIFYTVKNDYFNGQWEIIRNPKNYNHKAYLYNISIEDFKAAIQKSINENKVAPIEHQLPVAFFKPKYFIKNDIFEDSISTFHSLSSGEQQLIHSTQSIIYHILNVNSVFNSYNREKITFKNINIILDEVEIYYHPEYQKKFIAELIIILKRLKVKNILGINIIFSTHSPFLLSDIPHINVLRLDEGKIIYSNNERTFGANIYDLLANDFFVKGGFIGEYALYKIKEIIDYCNIEKFDLQKQHYYVNLSSVIGDEVIREKLILMLQDKKNNYSGKDLKLAILKKQIDQINSEIKSLEEDDFTS